MHPMVGGTFFQCRVEVQSAVASRGDWVYPAIPQANNTYGFVNMMALEGVRGAHTAVGVD
jgi:hypothetical protein